MEFIKFINGWHALLSTGQSECVARHDSVLSSSPTTAPRSQLPNTHYCFALHGIHYYVEYRRIERYSDKFFVCPLPVTQPMFQVKHKIICLRRRKKSRTATRSSIPGTAYTMPFHNAMLSTDGCYVPLESHQAYERE